MLILASAALCGSVPIAAASSSDAQATHAYLIAQYRLVTALLHEGAAESAAESAAAAQIARECPRVVSGMPKEPSLGTSSLSPHAKGERARQRKQEETIESELAAAVERPGDSLDREAEEAYVAEVRPLSWSNPAIASLLQAMATAKLQALAAPAPPACADAKEWAQSGYRVMSAASREFAVMVAARRRSNLEVAAVGALLKPYENASDRAVVRKTSAVEQALLASLEPTVQTVLKLDGIVGFPQIAPQEPAPVTVGHGRTAAGTRFQVSAGSEPGLLGAGSCHRSATVFYTRPGAPETLIAGVPNNPICLSSPQYRHPAVFCEAGIETIQTAVPASVRSVRLVLADGNAIHSRVVRVPRKDGGPAGVYAEELRGSASHAISLVELDSGGGVVLTVGLPRYRCVKPRKGTEPLTTVVQLASGYAPEGEPFTISAFGSFNGAPSLSVGTGVDPELNEIGPDLGPSKAFPWSLSIGCAPHPYAIIYGILAPPGKSVVARTPQSVVALNVVPVETRVHAKGPLVYGVFSALPSELTVLGVNGSTVYSENLQAKDTEVAQFCEGYVEP